MSKKIHVVDINSTPGARFKLFVKSWAISYFVIGVALEWLFFNGMGDGIDTVSFLTSIVLGFFMSCWILSITKPKPQVDPVSGKKVMSNYLCCPFCDSSNLGQRQVAIDRSAENAMVGYLALGKPGLILGCGPDEIQKHLVCYDCAQEFAYEEALVAQKYEGS